MTQAISLCVASCVAGFVAGHYFARLNVMQQNYIIWILGILSFAVGSLAGMMIRWRREIDRDIADNRVAIAKVEGMQKEVDRNAADIRDLITRVTDGRTRRLRERFKQDDMEDDP